MILGTMKPRTLLLAVFITLFLMVAGLASGAPPQPGRRALVKISLTSDADLASVEAAGLPIYARLIGRDNSSYLLAGLAIDREWPRDLRVTVLDLDMVGATYLLAYVMPDRPHPDWHQYGVPLLDDGLRVILRVLRGGAAGLSAAGVEAQVLTLDPKPLRPVAATISRATLTDPDPLVEEMLAQIDSTTLYSYTAGLSGEWPVMIDSLPYTITTRHTYSGEPIQKATDYVGERLDALGMQVDFHQWGGVTYPNVIGELTGLADPDRVFIIGGHLDDTSDDTSPEPIAPGADDNASGVAATLVAADILSQYPWNCTLRFALWTGEEQWLLGSSAYAQRAYERGEQILGYLNLDMIGYNSTLSSPDIDLHAKADMPETLVLAQLFVDVVDAYGLELVPEIVPNGTGASDHASFWQYGYPAILGIEDFGDFNPSYHTTNDLVENMDFVYMTEFVRASVGTFVHMSDCVCLPASQPQIAWEPDAPFASWDALVFTSTVSGTQPLTYTWDFGGPGYGIDLDTAAPTYTYTAPGTYTATLTVENSCGSDQASVRVDVLCLPPSAEMAADEPVPLRHPILFTATLTGTMPISFTWKFGGNSAVVGGDTLVPAVTYNEAGLYTVTLDLENRCGSALLTRQVEVLDRWFSYLPLVWVGR
jgi:hypothetical protein